MMLPKACNKETEDSLSQRLVVCIFLARPLWMNTEKQKDEDGDDDNLNPDVSLLLPGR
jgi:hypothetical protein